MEESFYEPIDLWAFYCEEEAQLKTLERTDNQPASWTNERTKISAKVSKALN